jgi:hypothetical protein
MQLPRAGAIGFHDFIGSVLVAHELLSGMQTPSPSLYPEPFVHLACLVIPLQFEIPTTADEDATLRIHSTASST